MACKFTDLPASSVDSKGRVTYYSYYIEEITPDGYDLQVTYGDPRTSGLEYYTATMTNKEQPKYTSLNVNKVWLNKTGGTTLLAPKTDADAVTLKVYRVEGETLNAGIAVVNGETEVPASDIKTITVEGQGGNGQQKVVVRTGDQLVITFSKAGINNFSVTALQVNSATDNSFNASSIQDGSSYTYTVAEGVNSLYFTGDSIGISVENRTTRSVNYKLTQAQAEGVARDESFERTLTLNATDKWRTSLDDLFAELKGTKFTYYVVEQDGDDYQAEYTYDGNTVYISNREKDMLEVDKTWYDTDGEMPLSKTDGTISFDLYQVENAAAWGDYTGTGSLSVDISGLNGSDTGGIGYQIYNYKSLKEVTGDTRIKAGSKVQLDIITPAQYNADLSYYNSQSITISGVTSYTENDAVDVYEGGTFKYKYRRYIVTGVTGNIKLNGFIQVGDTQDSYVKVTVLEEPTSAAEPSADDLISTKVGTVTVGYSSASIELVDAFKDSGISALPSNEKHWAALINNLPTDGLNNSTYTYHVVENSVSGFRTESVTPTVANTSGKITIKNVKDTPSTGSVKVTKNFSGITSDQLPEEFKINATWTGGSAELTISDDQPTGVTRTGSFPNYTWEISDLPIDTMVTFTESGYELDGYSVEINGSATAAAMTATVATTPGEATFTNSYTELTTGINIKKVKDDGTSVLEGAKFTLTKTDGSQTFTEQTSNASGEVSFSGLKVGNYTLIETEAPTNFQKISGEITFEVEASGSGLTITRTDSTADVTWDSGSLTFTVKDKETTTVTINKTWNNGETWLQGYTVEMTLKADSSVVSTTATANGENNPVILSADKMSATWTNLPKYQADGTTAIVYTVEETKVLYGETEVNKDMFTTTGGTVSGGVATIDNTPKTTERHAQKTWDDSNNADNKRSGSITFTLKAMADGNPVNLSDYDITGDVSQEITSEDWSAKVNWTSLPEYTKDGKAITYSIEEAAVEDYTMLTPTYDEATKTWTVTNKLGKASTPLSATKTMKGGATPADGYSFKLEAIDGAPMPDGESGRAVSPLTVTNVAGTINFGTINFKRTDLGSDASRTFQYTITEVAGSDANMIYDPAIYTVSVVVSYNSTTGELTAAEPTYTKKANATAADENVSSVTFQNEETTEIFVHKAWPGDVPMADEVEFWVYTKNAQGGFVEVRQKADGTDYDLGGDARYTANIKLNSANSWSGSLTGLPKYDNSGNQIQYYVVERGVTFNGEQTVYKWEVTDYFTVSPADAAYNGDNTVGIEVASDNSESKPLTITNTPLTTSITVTKKWEDSGMQDRVPEGATAKFKLVKVVRNSDNQITGLEEVKVDNAIVTVTLNGTVDATPTGTGIAGYESGAWKATFLNMPKFDANGKKITYAVVEVEQDDVYTVSYSTTEGSYQYAANDGWVNNQYTSFIVEKRWMTGGFANWDKDYGEENDQVKTIYFRLYRQVDGGTPVMVDEHGDPVTSGNGVMELKYSDVVKAPLTQYNTGGVDVAQGTDVHWMRKFPLLPGTNGEYFAVECSKPNGTAEIVEYGDKNNKGAALDAYKDIYMICPEFGGKDVETEEPTDHGTFCLKNKLIKVNVDKTWLATDYDDYVLKLQLLRNGEVYRTVNVEKGSNNWHYEMDDLPMANVEDGTTYSYGWNEIGVYASLAEAEADADGTSDKNLISNFTVTDPDVNTNSAHAFELSFTIINKELTYLDVVKKWSLNGGDPTDDTTDLTEISFYLYRKDGSGNSEIVDSATKIGKNAKKDVEHPEGAEAFTITRALKSGSTTDYEWKLHIDGLEKTDASGNAYTYWIQEVTVPGYSTTPTIKLANGTDVNATSNAPAESTIVITNSKFTVSLPSTGGTGTTIFYGAGLSLMLFAFLGFILNARKRSRGEGI